MPRGQGYGRGGYGGYGGRSTYQYDNRQPAAFQYQSFYDPIPVESLIESSARSQQEYDVGYAGALSAQDQLAQSLVGMQDIAAKNEILNQSIAGMNTTVKDKYGGDWGRAAKDVAAQITQVRSNPFWNTAKEADRFRKQAEELKIKYGPNAYIFNDPTKISVVDEEGNLRGAQEFAPDIVEAGDYVQTVRELIGNVSDNKWQEYGLEQAEVLGYLKTGNISAVTEERLANLAKDPDIQKAFLRFISNRILIQQILQHPHL